MHLSDGRENGFVCAVFFRKENVAKVMLESCFSIIMYTCVNSIFLLGLLNKCDLFINVWVSRAELENLCSLCG